MKSRFRRRRIIEKADKTKQNKIRSLMVKREMYLIKRNWNRKGIGFRKNNENNLENI